MTNFIWSRINLYWDKTKVPTCHTKAWTGLSIHDTSLTFIIIYHPHMYAVRQSCDPSFQQAPCSICWFWSSFFTLRSGRNAACAEQCFPQIKSDGVSCNAQPFLSTPLRQCKVCKTEQCTAAVPDNTKDFPLCDLCPVCEGKPLCLRFLLQLLVISI